MSLRRLALATTFVNLVAGCSSSQSVAQQDAVLIDEDAAIEADIDNDAADDTTANDTAVTDTATRDASIEVGPAASCPVSTNPKVGSACDYRYSCLYGDDPNPGCRYRYSCKSGAWKVQYPSAMETGCGWLKCPTTPPKSSDTCADSLTVAGGCWYDDGTYCACGYGKNWACYSPLSKSGCPKIVPNWGSPCTGTASCNYCGTYQLTCSAGVWSWSNASTRSCPYPK